jgi:cyclophilin family peptidyl-prolyl cis-trans isomerase
VISRLIALLGSVLCVATPVSAGTYVQFRTAWGDIDVELYDEDKPVTVRNFLRYVQSGRYENMIFHRCPTNRVTGLTDFVVQGGGFFVTNSQIEAIETFGSIPNEFGVGRRFSNTYGTIAMAKVGGDTNSATSQFFFNLNNNSFLDAATPDGYFTVFGRIVGTNSTNVLNSYLGLSIDRGIKNLGGPFDTLPVTYFGTRPPTELDLEFVSTLLVDLRINRTAGATELNWSSLSANHVYHVQYTTNLPPQWHGLVSTNGIGRNGEMMRVIETPGNEVRRFYRVRVGL